MADDTGNSGNFGPEKIWPLVAAGFAIVFGWQYFQKQSAAPADVAYLRYEDGGDVVSKPVTMAECKAAPDRIWVSSDEFKECIAYVITPAVNPGGRVLVFFNGDVPKPDRARNMRPESWQGERNRSAEAARAFGVSTVVMGRPGTFGSTGFHQPGGMREDAYVMNQALDLLKQRHGFTTLMLAGQSGGARLIAQLLALQRSDIACAAMASGAYDLPQQVDGSRSRTNIWGQHARRYLVPMREAGNIPKISGQRLFVIGDPADKIAEFSEQRAWADKLRELGHGVSLLEAKGNGNDNHGLADAGITAAGACANGRSDTEIAAAIKRQ